MSPYLHRGFLRAQILAQDRPLYDEDPGHRFTAGSRYGQLRRDRQLAEIYSERAEPPNAPGIARRFGAPGRLVSRAAERGFSSMQFQHPLSGAKGVD